MKVTFAIILLMMIIFCAISVYADITIIPDTASLPSDGTSPMNGDNIALIITALCLSASALVALLITSVIIKRKK